ARIGRLEADVTRPDPVVGQGDPFPFDVTPVRCLGRCCLRRLAGSVSAGARATGGALVDPPGAGAGGGGLHRGGWVERPVRRYRDAWGIPHVRAHSVHDVFVGQGYAHAMDRLWQMDAARKQMEGRWAEWVGAAGLPADRLARRLRAAAASIR